ncbi:MerR family transcriptional regulator [Paenibacillus thermotolerans]|uniref:MerR family transcriptional regulator n=1 Tax=Paenibacillus thermotolerans TaxID=3027807 RepID=UPI002368C281|nr:MULTISPECIES: MerR family transcriptional regulator [unclassified Paenibacillus]
MNTYKIEEVAKKCGLTKRTIRYYEEIGLLFSPDRSEGGFRLYSDKHIERLNQIINARDVLGVSLQELQEFISISEQFANQRKAVSQIDDRQEKLKIIGELEQTVVKQLQAVDQKLDKLNEIRKQIGGLYDKIQEAKAKYNQE